MTHSLFDLLRNAVVHYGYWAVGAFLLAENAGIPVPGETILLLACFLSYSEHELRLPWIIVVAVAAASLGDNLGFALGYYGGRPLLRRYQSIFRIQNRTFDRGERLFMRYGAATVFLARFIFGLRIIAGPLAGVLRMHWRKFTFFNLLGAAAWVSAVSAAGYFFGQHWERLASNMKRLDIFVGVLVLLIALILWGRSRRSDRTEVNPASEK